MIITDAESTEYLKLFPIPRDQFELQRIFFPYGVRRQLRLLRGEAKLVHYTSAAAAVSIIRNKEVWMRKTSCMNDFMEVQHGVDCLYAAYKDPACGERFKKAVESISPGWREGFEKLFDTWTPHIFNDTYLTCLSEHYSHEDVIGRLSMWRAYGPGSGVALVLNTTAFKDTSGALGAITSPVEYLRDVEFKSMFNAMTSDIEESANYLRTIDKQVLNNYVFAMFRFAVLSTKHPGFKEEQEWRVIYSPLFSSSPHMRSGVEVVNGVAQPIQKIPLRDIPGAGMSGIEIPNLLDRIIIGPTPYPRPAYEAFVALLREQGVADPESKVVISDIPLR